MARRNSLHILFSRLGIAGDDPRNPASEALFRQILETAPGLAVAKAAAIIANTTCGGREDDDAERDKLDAPEWGESFFPALVSAFERCCAEPLKEDKGAHGKTALLLALDRMEYHNATPFLAGATYTQFEPEAGRSVDRAAPLRARAAAGLVRLRHPSRLKIITDMLWDNYQDARLGAVRAAAYDGSDSAELLLRAKALAGDKGEDFPSGPGDGGAVVLGEVFAALLSLGGAGNIDIVASFLEDADSPEPLRQQAALALGESRLPEALPALECVWKAFVDWEIRQGIIFGVALHNSDESMNLLRRWLEESEKTGQTVILKTLQAVFGPESPRYARLAESVPEPRKPAGKNRGPKGK